MEARMSSIFSPFPSRYPTDLLYGHVIGMYFFFDSKFSIDQISSIVPESFQKNSKKNERLNKQTN
jgi:hypothetical protein